MHTLEDYKSLLAAVRTQTGLDMMVPDESGLVSVRVQDEYNLNLQFIEATDKILCFVEVTELPKDAGKAVYRDLLVGGLFGKDTAGGHFAIEPETEAVVYNYIFDFETASQDIDEFIETLEKILQLCDIWADRMRDDLTGAADATEKSDDAEAQPSTPAREFRFEV